MDRKKFFTVFAVTALVVTGITWAVLKEIAIQKEYAAENAPSAREKMDEAAIQRYAATHAGEQTDPTTTSLNISSSSSEASVVHVMHLMTHQKVEAPEKWGAVEMTKDTINEVYGVVKGSDFPDKDQLMDIVNRWKNGDFSKIVQDHNYLWGLEGGEKGKATRAYTSAEESNFVNKYFADRITTSEDINE